MALMEYGEGYKQCRKLTHQGLNPEAVKSYREIQESIVYMYLDSLLKRPEDFVSEIRLYVQGYAAFTLYTDADVQGCRSHCSRHNVWLFTEDGRL